MKSGQSCQALASEKEQASKTDKQTERDRDTEREGQGLKEKDRMKGMWHTEHQRTLEEKYNDTFFIRASRFVNKQELKDGKTTEIKKESKD